LPIDAVSKVRIDSVVTKYSATKAKQHNILSESITSQKTSLAIEKHGKHKKPTKLDFSRAKGVVFLSSDYHIIDDPQIIAKQCSANKTHQDDRDHAPTSKNEEKMHGGADETGQASSSLTVLNRPGRFSNWPGRFLWFQQPPMCLQMI
jgi:hypothetical protein